MRGGSIDNRLGGMERAREGGRIHRRLQKAAGEGYEAEVSLSIDMELDGHIYTVEGRADGLIRPPAGELALPEWEAAGVYDRDGEPCEGGQANTVRSCEGEIGGKKGEAHGEGPTLAVDEIKTTLLPFSELREDWNRAHWAQALCYAHICAEREGLEEVGVRLTYFQAETEEIRYYRRRFSRVFLAGFFRGLLEKYKIWAEWREGWEEKRDAAAGALAFPFAAFRPGQRQMAAAVYRAIRDGKRLFCEAPTGIGKSMSALFPAVKALGEGECEKIFYLTAKTVARQSAVDALEILRGKGARLKSVNLTAKDKICFLEERNCNPEACRYADGHFDRVNDALYALLGRADAFSREVIEEAAREFRVCPYELSLDLSLFCDCIVCDYNYLFDPEASLKRFFGGEGGDYAFLIDEAHNLVDRARSMYSASLRKSDFLSLKKKIGKGQAGLTAALGKVNRAFLDLRRDCLAEGQNVYHKVPSRSEREDAGVFTSDEPPEDLARAAAGFCAACEAYFSERAGTGTGTGRSAAPEWETELLELYFAGLDYQRTLDLFDDAYTSYVYVNRSEAVSRLMCLNPTRPVSACMDKGKAAVLFSATLTPFEYFRSLLGGEEAAAAALPSPFPPERLGLYAACRVSTRFKDRQKSLGEIADLIAAAVAVRPGNYMVFFPSYAYLKAVYEQFAADYPQIPTLVQESEMDEAARQAFLDSFQAEGGGLVGFCVLGGLYAEGVDLKGDRLIGAIVVGVGLPQVGPDQEILKEYFDRDGQGFAYAYRYPGMHKVLQAAGRVIRDDGDKGIVLLIDDRFVSGAYRRLYPPQWGHMRFVGDGEELGAALKGFWAE